MHGLLIRVRQIMLLEVGFESERLVALGTNMRLLTLVDQIMFLQVGFGREIFATDVTHVPLGFLWIVDEVVFVKIRFVTERFVTGVAGVGLLAVVQGDMFQEVCLAREPFEAHLADEGLQFAVGGGAVFVRGLFLHLEAVGLKVFGQIGAFGEGFATQVT